MFKMFGNVFSQPPWSETSGEVQQSKWKLSSEIQWTLVEVELKLHRLCWLCHIGAEPLSPVRDGASRLALAAPLAPCRARAPRANGHGFTNVSHNAESFLTFFYMWKTHFETPVVHFCPFFSVPLLGGFWLLFQELQLGLGLAMPVQSTGN